MEIIKKALKFVWSVISAPVKKGVKAASLADETFQFDLRTGRNAVLHVPKKYVRPILKKVVNDMLKEKKYVVTSIKYRFRGADVFVEQK
ncbi:MAG: hypothetical protein IKK43_00035 [Clostridia bacterium]|nr:hypothetical protein [Clostridia bacterium]